MHSNFIVTKDAMWTSDLEEKTRDDDYAKLQAIAIVIAMSIMK